MLLFLQDHLAAIIIFLVLVMISSSSLSFSANLPVSTSPSSSSTTTNNSYNVMSYGAIGDGTSDDSQLSGKIIAPSNKQEWIGFHINAWLTFSYVNGLVITGDGQIDGQGSAWWSQPCLHDLHTGIVCKGPTALVFYRCNGLRLSGITHRNSPRVHIILTNCYDVIISNLRITAPETSPNTDGINVSGSKNVTVENSYIETGDDCIAVSGGSSFVNITGISCGSALEPWGKGGHDKVEEIHVRNCTLRGTLTGVRIKSWQGGTGYARKISFEKIKLIDVNNPVIIDQFYCPSQTLAVELSDIRYRSIVGTSGTDQVINLSCSGSHGCTNLRIEQVYIKSTTPGKRVYANCVNAHGTWSHTIPDVKCLLP